MKKESKRKSSEGNPIRKGLRKVTILDKEEKR